MAHEAVIPIPRIEQAIFLIRGQRVILDRDLAALYGVTTGNLNKAVRRNLDRFPEDFMFQLNAEEAEASSFQIGSLKQGRNIKYLPLAFSEQGVAMLSSVLRSKQAVQVNVAIMRAFVRLLCDDRLRSTKNSPENWGIWKSELKETIPASVPCSKPSVNSCRRHLRHLNLK